MKSKSTVELNEATTVQPIDEVEPEALNDSESKPSLLERMRMEAESRQKAETPNPAPKKSTRVILLFSSTRAGEPTGVIHPHLGKANERLAMDQW